METIPLYCPSLNRLQQVITTGLFNDFSEIRCDIVDCPDFRSEPFNLSIKGLGGNSAIIQLGGTHNFIPVTRKDKVYDYRKISKELNFKKLNMIGAAAYYSDKLQILKEVCVDVAIDGDSVWNHTKEISRSCKSSNDVVVCNSNVHETQFHGIGSLYLCRGGPCQVIRLQCKGSKKKKNNFASSIVKVLEEKFDGTIALGVIMYTYNGSVLHTVPKGIRNFPKEDITAEKRMENNLNIELAAPFITLGTLIASLPENTLRAPTNHLHSFNSRSGGHYHFDMQLEELNFEVYLTPAEKFYHHDCSLLFTPFYFK